MHTQESDTLKNNCLKEKNTPKHEEKKIQRWCLTTPQCNTKQIHIRPEKLAPALSGHSPMRK